MCINYVLCKLPRKRQKEKPMFKKYQKLFNFVQISI